MRRPVPIGGAEPHEGGYEIDPAVVGHGARKFLDFGSAREKLQSVAQPLYDGPGDEHTPFEGVFRRKGAALPEGRAQQAVRADSRGRAHVHEEEAPRAVGVLRRPRRKAGLSEGGRLLVARDARDRNGPAPERGIGFGDHSRARNDFGEDRLRDVKELQEFVVPLSRAQIAQKRARGVRQVRRMAPSARKLPDEPRVDRAEGDFAPFGPGARPRNPVEKPVDLRRREVRIETQAGFARHHLFFSAAAQLFAEIRRAAVLPHDGGRERLSGFSIPENRRFALIGEPDRGDFLRPDARAAKRPVDAAARRLPNLEGVVLHPARSRIVLSELFLFEPDDLRPFVEEERAGARCALIKCEDVLHVGSPVLACVGRAPRARPS